MKLTIPQKTSENIDSLHIDLLCRTLLPDQRPSNLGLGVLSRPLRLPGHVVDKEKVIQGARGAAQAICRAKARPGLWRPRATEVQPIRRQAHSEVAILAPDQDHQRRWHLKFRIPGFWHVVWACGEFPISCGQLGACTLCRWAPSIG